MSARLNAHRFTKLETNEPKLHDASKNIEKADFRITTQVIYDVISNANMITLEESAHAATAVRNKARADRLARVQTVSARLNARRFTKLEMNEPKLYDASKNIEKAMELEKDKKVVASLSTTSGAPPTTTRLPVEKTPRPPTSTSPVRRNGMARSGEFDYEINVSRMRDLQSHLLFPSANQHMDARNHWKPAVPCETCLELFHTEEAADPHMEAIGHYENYCVECDRRFLSENCLRQTRETRKTDRAWNGYLGQGRSTLL
ncbi:hypothetical protein N7471_000929 [Penicillium samsonianum]|uniref:uncharacterized protein n=1 Tax=Penicillium samsonianum TaxID=1882272 RepID=UPI00254969F0|nr:uncharacterized protein N7471_000929 [Penicillium samsonianum]KAJ6149730.1 hypothetical protein N7471_000929 [Penicillium samsonianum]